MAANGYPGALKTGTPVNDLDKVAGAKEVLLLPAPFFSLSFFLQYGCLRTTYCCPRPVLLSQPVIPVTVIMASNRYPGAYKTGTPISSLDKVTGAKVTSSPLSFLNQPVSLVSVIMEGDGYLGAYKTGTPINGLNPLPCSLSCFLQGCCP